MVITVSNGLENHNHCLYGKGGRERIVLIQGGLHVKLEKETKKRDSFREGILPFKFR